MSRNYLDDLSIALINRAEHDCALDDPGMAAAAAMVLVGDVYALRICYGAASPPAPSSTHARRQEDDELSPFIR